MSRLFLVTTVLLICVLLQAADPQPAPNAPTKDAAQAGGATPQEAFEIFRKAVIADDWTTALAQFDEPSRQFLTAGMIGGAMLGPFGEQGKEIARAHITDEQKLTARMAEIMKLPQKEQNAAARSLAEYVKDAPGLCQKITALFREKKLENWMLDLNETKLEIKTEEADTVQGSMHSKNAKGGSSSEPMNFRKINGRWFLNYNG